MFNINKAIKESHLSSAVLRRLQKEIKADYPNDPMLFELHMIRAIRGSAGKKLNGRKRALAAR